MKFAIETRYMPATDTNGARIVARLKGSKSYYDQRQRQLTMPYEYALDTAANHYLAMARLVAKWGDANDAEGVISEDVGRGYLFTQAWQTRHTHYALQVKGFIPLDAEVAA
jgi:hypothetical protein